MKQFSPLTSLYVLQPISKGLGVFYLVLLPIFYSDKLITASQVGYIGAIQIVFLIVSAISVAAWLHTFKTREILILSSFISLTSILILFSSVTNKNITLMLIAFALNGLVVGLSTSGANVIAMNTTRKGNRFGAMANLAVITDVVRVAFPLIATGIAITGKTTNAIYIIFLTSLVFLFVSYKSPEFEDIAQADKTANDEAIHSNKQFIFFLLVEFLDSFGSSQLFVYLPLLYLTKGYTIQNSLLTQSLIFLGYIAGRVFVSHLAKRINGRIAISIAEIGMAFSIILLLLASNIYIICFLSFILGIFTRGTSPVIKALAFDSLHKQQSKRGAAIHIVAGDSGNALGQLTFGFLFTYLGANSPFIASAGIVILIAILCAHNSGLKIDLLPTNSQLED